MILTSLLLLAVQSAQPVAATAAAPVEDKVICRREVRTGSNMSRRVCFKRSEWTRQMRENGGAMERLRGPIAACPAGMPGCS